MSLNLKEAAKSFLPDSLIIKAASLLGETENNTRKAFNGAIPAIFAGLLHQSSRNEEFNISGLLKDVVNSGATDHLNVYLETKKSSPASPGTVSDISALLPDWLKSIFGNKLINIINAISIYADVKSSSANTILNLTAPVAMTPLAKYAEEKKLNSGELEAFLQSQKSSIIADIPAGFNLSGSLGIESLNDIGIKTMKPLPEPAEYHRKKTGGGTGKWVWPFLLLATFGGLLWYFSQRDSGGTETTAANADTTTRVEIKPADTISTLTIQGKLDSLTGNFIYDQGIITELKMPDSSLIRAGQNSTEARLLKMLGDTSWHIDTADKTKNWVTFDRVYFETGKSILTAGSQIQVKNIVTILKNFPNGAVKIGGYTDNQGDSVINKKIADERAKMVMNELIKLGAGANQITEAVGYGPDHPVCPLNDTPECKARNRRVDLKVAAK